MLHETHILHDEHFRELTTVVGTTEVCHVHVYRDVFCHNAMRK